MLALLLYFSNSYGQEKRYPFEEITPGCNCPNFEWTSRGQELKNVKESNNDMEIRLDIHAKWNDRITTVISKKEGKYEAYFYHKRKEAFPSVSSDSLIKYKGHYETYNFKKFSITGINLDSIVKVLINEKIELLPNQNEIYSKGFLSPYIVSYKIEGKIRSFQFGSPKGFMNEFPDEPVYKHYDAILELFLHMIDPMYRQILNDIRLQEEN